jgi:hypothetical protein
MFMRPETARKYAYRSLPHLVQRAHQGRTIYYSELGEKIGLNAQGLGDLLDYVRDEICVPQGLPHLSILVVRKNEAEMPPDEVIEKSGVRPGETHQAAFERLKGEVFHHKGWDRLLVGFGLPTTGQESGGGR